MFASLERHVFVSYLFTYHYVLLYSVTEVVGMKSLIFFRFHFPLGNPALSSISLTAPGAVGFKQVADEFRSFKSKSLSKAPGVTLEEFGQILKVRLWT